MTRSVKFDRDEEFGTLELDFIEVYDDEIELATLAHLINIELEKSCDFRIGVVQFEPDHIPQVDLLLPGWDENSDPEAIKTLLQGYKEIVKAIAHILIEEYELKEIKRLLNALFRHENKRLKWDGKDFKYEVEITSYAYSPRAKITLYSKNKGDKQILHEAFLLYLVDIEEEFEEIQEEIENFILNIKGRIEVRYQMMSEFKNYVRDENRFDLGGSAARDLMKDAFDINLSNVKNFLLELEDREVNSEALEKRILEIEENKKKFGGNGELWTH